MRSKIWILLATLLLAPCSHAETWGMPIIEEKQMTMNSVGPVALEMVTQQVIHHVGDRFAGTIRIVWADDGFTDAASLLRTALISKGIAPERVQLTPKSGGYKGNAVTGIEVWIRQIVMRLTECDYASQSYRFNENEILGCALNNTRSSVIINSNEYAF